MKLNQGDTIGILGGGQLAQFLIIAASKLGFNTVVFDPNENSPAFRISTKYICESFFNEKAPATHRILIFLMKMCPRQ